MKLAGRLSSDVLGRPILTPLALAFCIPLLTLWLIRSASSSANTDHISSIPFVIGSFLPQSITMLPITSFICFSCAKSMISHSSFVDLEILETSVVQMVSPTSNFSTSLDHSTLFGLRPLTYSQYMFSSCTPSLRSSRLCRSMSCLVSSVEHLQ